MVEEARRVERVVEKVFDEKEWSPNTQPMHDDKSPGPHSLKINFCNRMWACVVSGLCGD